VIKLGTMRFPYKAQTTLIIVIMTNKTNMAF